MSPVCGGGVNLVEEFPFGSGADHQQDLLSELTQIFFCFKGVEGFLSCGSQIVFSFKFSCKIHMVHA